jgi:ribosomal protein L37E
MRRKVYGQSRNDSCVFCKSNAIYENSQGLPVCKDHKKEVINNQKCICGEYMEVKKSKWGAFYLCKNCGPISLSKYQKSNIEDCGFKLNKKYRKEETKKEKKYTIDELEMLWDDI